MDRSQYSNIVSEIKFLACLDRVCTFVKVDSSKVRVSHCLTNFARAEHSTGVWLRSGLDVVLQELHHALLVAMSS
jgi:hypothetical protein